MASARVLVVDDDSLARRKLVLAVNSLGHTVEDVDSGDAALDRLRNPGVDIVLLDIEMPGKSGYDVLSALGSFPEDRRPPVIVISSLDDPEEIARAIELGAVDFLPKAFNAVILRARINASLREARRQEDDRRTLQQIRRLTAAAEALDADERNPRDLAIDDLAEGEGAIAVLSRVLLNKSIMVYNRRLSHAYQIRTLNGILLLLFIGACFGLKPAIAKLSLAEVQNPISVAFYTMGLSTVFTTLYAVWSKARAPRVSRRSARFFALLAFLTFLPQVLLFWVAESVPGVMIAILVSLESFLVFFIAAGIGLERLSVRRFMGLLLGVAGVGVLLLPFFDIANSTVQIHWLFITMLIPACFASETIMMSMSKAIDADLIAVVAVTFGLSTSVLFVASALNSGFVPLHAVPGKFELSLIAFSLADSVAMIALAKLIDYAGPVFSGQKAYTVSIGGVLWSVLLLNEVVSLTSFTALVLILLGLYFVAKRADAAKLIARPAQA
ncbi:response regulator [Defluviimonas salinarum]|uniref:Response regulator n=1 Tax=Defluviimonas salinarum TaxID=2992147 RepID=A0ABT3IYE7_9RHOB|nr:response regulator [Defluviimonas salinarum]MCW3780411.1 response regulator [Defluviimonas salinarum]